MARPNPGNDDGFPKPGTINPLPLPRPVNRTGPSSPWTEEQPKEASAEIGTPMAPMEQATGIQLGYFIFAGEEIADVYFDAPKSSIFIEIRLGLSRLGTGAKKALPLWVKTRTRLTIAEWVTVSNTRIPGLVFSVFSADECPKPRPNKPVIDEIRLVGQVDRDLSELKYILDHPDEFDMATFQTIKHHVEDMELFVKYALGKLAAIKALPPVAEQIPRGY